MQTMTAERHALTQDEFWLLEHQPVYTLGQAGRQQWVRSTGTVPVVHCDRGGQVTYHGPGQAVIYGLVDLRRRGLGIRDWVTRLEQVTIDLLAAYGLVAQRREGAPGVYVAGAKIAALGLRIKKGCCYHGLALNVAMDLTPFAGIVPCGLLGVAVTQTCSWGITADLACLREQWMKLLLISLRDAEARE